MTDKPKPKRNPNAISIHAAPGTDPDQLAAELAVRPSAHAAVTIRQIIDSKNQADLTYDALIGELQRHGDAVRGGDLVRQEAMLTAQADTLDALTHTLVRRALIQTQMPLIDGLMRLALKAQSQCRATLETLAAIKNPTPVAFVRQANIAAGPQQVNNGVPRAREIQNPPNEQSRLTHEERQRLDHGAPSATSRAHPAMATVGTIDRAPNGGR